MSTSAEPSPLFQSYPLGEPRPFAVPHRGVHYRGEIILSDQWRAQWGLPLEQDVYFRIVVLGSRLRMPRRLSRILVERILNQKVDQRLEDFLKIVQASDLSSLSSILNYELVVFIRELAGTP